ncbi:DUF4398 domain-containing protein [Bdellovibrionota bacterium FG-1]
MTRTDKHQACNISSSAQVEGAGRKFCSFFFLVSLLTLSFTVSLGGCAILGTRPVQEMSNTAASIRAAREVQADTLAPELFRQANEWFFKAKREYKFKNFDLAQSYAKKARLFAEEAEFEAIRNGGNRSDTAIADPMASGLTSPSPPQTTPSREPYPYPTPCGTPADAPPPPSPTAPEPLSSPSPSAAHFPGPRPS